MVKKWILAGLSILYACLNTSNLLATQAENNPANCTCPNISPRVIQNSDDYNWAITVLYGSQLETIMNKAIRFDLPLADGAQRSRLWSADLAYQLKKSNVVRRMFQPIISTIEVAANVTFRDDPNGNIEEFNPYLRFTWNNFPWNKYLTTTLTIGEGISYATGLTSRETRDTKKAEDVRRLLNYLMVEATIALPSYPQWQAVYRLHHRSGVFGLYTSGVVGSTAVAVGLRYQIPVSS